MTSDHHAPYEQVADAVSRALENVKEERAALELQSRGAVFDGVDGAKTEKALCHIFAN